ncbi:MAG: carboxylating nicotinate-nucleotide diphosphorylase [Bradymonadia bacterium]
MNHSPLLNSLLDIAIAEDYAMGDITADALIPQTATGQLSLIAKESMMVCGQVVLDTLAKRFELESEPGQRIADGEMCVPGDTIARYRGLTRALLAFERPALNFLQRLSGIATLTSKYVERISHTNARLLDTRKTLPGHRLLEKYATRIGGAINHRSGLDRGWLIKENHLREVGSIAEAVQRAKAFGVHGLKVEIEVEDLEELDQAVTAGADIVLLDNFSVSEVKQAVQRHGARVTLEASGGIDLESIAQFAETGVHLIAVGALTHSARAMDISGSLTPDQDGSDTESKPS